MWKAGKQCHIWEVSVAMNSCERGEKRIFLRSRDEAAVALSLGINREGWEGGAEGLWGRRGVNSGGREEAGHYNHATPQKLFVTSSFPPPPATPVAYPRCSSPHPRRHPRCSSCLPRSELFPPAQRNPIDSATCSDL